MVRDAMTRLANTRTYIGTQKAASRLSDAEFDTIEDALDQWMRDSSVATKQTLSGLMSQNDAAVRANKAGRKNVRSAILLQCALAAPQDQWAGLATFWKASPDHASSFRQACAMARDSVYSSDEKVTQMLADLRANPLQVLQTYQFNVDGGNKDGNPLTYKVWMNNGTYKFSCMGLGAADATTVQGVNVKATAYASIKNTPGNITAVNSANGPGANLMLTTQFTGCSFCFMKSADGQNMRAAHIDPGKGDGAPSGAEMSGILRPAAGFENGNGGQMKVYGRVADNSDVFGYPNSAKQMIVVGVRQGTEWRLYSQITGQDDRLQAQRIDG